MEDLISIAAIAPSSTPQSKIPQTQTSIQKPELVLPDANFDPLYGYIAKSHRDPMERTAITLHNDRFKGLYTTETINENPIFGENLAATTQSTLDSVMNDVQVGAVNFGSMFASTFTSIYDMLAEMSLTPGNNSLTSKIAANRAEFEKDHLNFTSAEQVESPYLSMVTTTNGLGDFFKSSAYGLGAAAGIYVQAVLTGGLGTVPNLAKNARLLYQGTSALKGISNILKASSGVTAALKLGDYVNRGKNLVTSLAQHYIGAYGEAEFEADESKQAFLEKYKQNFYQENGRLPNKEDLVEAESVAQAAHDARFALNAALLTATNYAMISTITKPFRKVTSGLEKLTQSGVTPFLTKTGIGLDAVAPKFRPNFNFNHKLFLSAEKGINKVLPFLAKTEITWMEGVEETFQYLIQKSTDNYYSNYLNNNSNQNLKKYLDENISGVLGQMYKDRGSMLDTESIKAGLSGIISGTGQNVFANVVSKYRPKIDQNGRFTIENVDKINKDELEVIKKGVNNFFKEAVNTTSIRGLSAEKNVDQLAALTNINRQQNSTNSELTNEMLKSQSRFVSFYDAIKIGQHDIVSHIVKNQLADATLEEFNELLGYTGVHAKTVEEKGAIIDNVLSSIDKVKKSTELIESNFTNPYKVGTHVHGAFEKLKETLSYHQYMIGEVSDLKTNLEQNISELAKLPATQEMFNNQHDTLMLDIKNLKEELKLYTLLDPNTTKLSAESQKDKKALEKQIENKEETLKLIDDDNLSLEYKLEAIAKAHSLNFSPNDIKNAYDYFRVTKAAENHVIAYNKLNKLTPLNFVDSFVEYMEEAQQHSEVLAKIENSADLSDIKDSTTKEIIEQEAEETKTPVAEVKKTVETKIVNTKPGDVTQKETSYTIEDIKQLKSVPVNSMINYKGLVYRYLGDNKLATLKKPTYHFATIEADGSLSPSEEAKEWIDRAGLVTPVEASDGSLITTGLSVVDIALMKYNAAQRMLKTEKALVENLMTLIDVVADEKLPDLPEVKKPEKTKEPTAEAEKNRNNDPSIESKLAWENWSLDTNDMTASFDKTPEALEKRRLITEQFITGDITIDDLDLVEIPAASKPKEVAFKDESNKLVSNDGQRSDYYALVLKEDPSIILYSFRNPEMYTITPDVIASFTEETQKALKDYTLYSVVSAIKQKPQEIEKLRLALFPQKDSSKMSRWIDFTLSYFASYNYLKQNGFNKENIEKVFDLTWFRYRKDIYALVQEESVHNILYPVVLNNIVFNGIVYFNNTWWEKVGTSFEQITDPNILDELINIYSEDIFDKNLTQFYVTQIKDTEKSTFQATYLTNNSDNNPEVLKEIYELLTTEIDANERLIKLTSQYHITNNLIKQKLKEQLVPSYNINIDKKNNLVNINIYFSTKEEKIKTPKYDIRITIDENGNVSAKSLKNTAEPTTTDIHIFKGIGTVSINDADLIGERQVFMRYSTFTKPKAFVEEAPNVFAQAQIVQEDYLETPIEQEETPEFVEVTVNGQKYNLNMEKIYTQFPQFKDAKFESTKELLEELDLVLEEADLNIEDFLEDTFPAQQNFVYLSENLEKEIETLMNTCKL